MGSSRSNWKSLLEEIRRSPKVQEDIKFMYGRKYGWAVRFRLTGKLLASLYPNSNYFVAQINLSRDQLLEAENVKLHENAQRAIETANLYPEGKWLFIAVRSAADLRDVRRLVKLKKGEWPSRARDRT